MAKNRETMTGLRERLKASIGVEELREDEVNIIAQINHWSGQLQYVRNAIRIIEQREQGDAGKSP